MGVSETACGRGGCLDPSPNPLPWTWTGGAARRQIVQDGLRRLQEGLRKTKMASKIAQDSPTRLTIVNDMPPRSSKTALRRLQEAKEPRKEAPERRRNLPLHLLLRFLLHPPLLALGVLGSWDMATWRYPPSIVSLHAPTLL